ncbi:hypothetical protein HOD30_02670 [Candidatus Peregrinibacteria bacterium]|jgi:hypothetical protein|nr:hypothetical protein [Candidatus Peregrinibacteria bacterium]MBT4631570.1 hypothetical protein [Candidatus Peregrinibacteria bacterium]MBT5517006.1 hypothetical protein [Candidatus Peregrinibacteria bacterium]
MPKTRVSSPSFNGDKEKLILAITTPEVEREYIEGVEDRRAKSRSALEPLKHTLPSLQEIKSVANAILNEQPVEINIGISASPGPISAFLPSWIEFGLCRLSAIREITNANIKLRVFNFASITARTNGINWDDEYQELTARQRRFLEEWIQAFHPEIADLVEFDYFDEPIPPMTPQKIEEYTSMLLSEEGLCESDINQLREKGRKKSGEKGENNAIGYAAEHTNQFGFGDQKNDSTTRIAIAGRSEAVFFRAREAICKIAGRKATPSIIVPHGTCVIPPYSPRRIGDKSINDLRMDTWWNSPMSRIERKGPIRTEGKWMAAANGYENFMSFDTFFKQLRV